MRAGLKVALVVGSAAVVLAAAITVLTINNDQSPEDAVRDYVGLLAKRDAAAAGAEVAPGNPVAATALRSARGHLTITSAFADESKARSGTVPVDVDYAVDGHLGEATLRVREGSAYGVFTRWRVIDPLLVPVTVQTTVPPLATAFVGGARVPASGSDLDGYPQRKTWLYPGEYPVRGQSSPYLSATADPLFAVPDTDRPVVASVSYRPTAKLQRIVLGRITAHTRKCAAAGRKMARDCPLGLRLRAERGKHVTITGTPRLDQFGAAQAPYRSGKPPLYFSTDFTTLRDGASYRVVGRAGVTARGAVTVRFEAQ